jgi:hypothetical protein
MGRLHVPQFVTTTEGRHDHPWQVPQDHRSNSDDALTACDNLPVVTVRRPELVMALAAVALVVDSLLPWYVARWSSMRYGSGQMTEHANTASAWAASTGWSAGIALALAAAGGWLIWPRRHSRRGRVAATVVLALAAVATTVGTWLAAKIESTGDATTLTFVAATAGVPRPGEAVRDALNSGTLGWGSYLGVLLMLTIVGCAFAVGHPDVQASPGGSTIS